MNRYDDDTPCNIEYSVSEGSDCANCKHIVPPDRDDHSVWCRKFGFHCHMQGHCMVFEVDRERMERVIELNKKHREVSDEQK